MQLTLLVVNFFLITIISREYGAETYGEYASSKSLSVLIGTAAVMSLALVVTKLLAQKNEKALDPLKKLANQGVTKAQCTLGYIYLQSKFEISNNIFKFQ